MDIYKPLRHKNQSGSTQPGVTTMTMEERMIDDKWPFKTEAEAAEHAELRGRGYALLRKAHEMWMAAIEERR